MFIVSPFNATWSGLLLITCLCIVGITKYSKTHSRRDTEKILLGVDFACIAIFFIYKYLILHDSYYAELCLANGQTVSKPQTEFVMCHLCNMQMILLPVAIVSGSRYLRAYCFMVTPPGAALSLLMPMLGFSGYSLFVPRVFGYYATHLMLFFSSVSLCPTGLYKTEYKDIPVSGLFMVLASFMAFCVNVVFIKTGIATDANFFQVMSPNDNAVLGMLWNYIPYPWLFYLPVIAFMCVYLYFELFVIKTLKKLLLTPGNNTNIECDAE